MDDAERTCKSKKQWGSVIKHAKSNVAHVRVCVIAQLCGTFSASPYVCCTSSANQVLLFRASPWFNLRHTVERPGRVYNWLSNFQAAKMMVRLELCCLTTVLCARRPSLLMETAEGFLVKDDDWVIITFRYFCHLAKAIFRQNIKKVETDITTR